MVHSMVGSPLSGPCSAPRPYKANLVPETRIERRPRQRLRARFAGADPRGPGVARDEAAWALAGGDDECLRWLLLWTAREAQGKSHGTGLLEPERIRATSEWQAVADGWTARIAGDASTMVRSVVAGGFVVSLVLPESAPHEAIATWLAQNLRA